MLFMIRLAFLLASSAIFLASVGSEPVQNTMKTWGRYASLAVPFGKGFLVSIIPREAAIEMGYPIGHLTAWQKYAADIAGTQNELLRKFGTNIIYRPIEEADFAKVEEAYGFGLRDEIIVFGGEGQGNATCRATGYYVKNNLIGYSPTVEDIMAYVPGSPKTDAIVPVWAKKYSPGDETYCWIDLPLVGSYSDRAVYGRVHELVSRELDQAALKSGAESAVIANSDEFAYKTYRTLASSTDKEAFLVIANGISRPKGLQYCLAFVLDGCLEMEKELIPASVRKDDRYGYTVNRISLKYVYRSKALGQDLVFMRWDSGLGSMDFLAFRENGEIVILRIGVTYGC